MRKASLVYSCFAVLTLCLGCGDDGEEPVGAGGSAGSSGGSAGSTGGGGGGNSLCQEGCVLTLAADCGNGPPTQTQCVTDCEMLMTGSCGTEYQALQACAEGEAITCNAMGIPVIEACSTEQSTFIACLN